MRLSGGTGGCYNEAESIIIMKFFTKACYNNLEMNWAKSK